jgi:hypothetical protein
MTESMHTDGPSTPPSGDQPRPINTDAVSELLEGGALVTESELSAWAESRSPRLFDPENPKYWPSGDGDGLIQEDSRPPSRSNSVGFFQGIQDFFFSRPRG